MEWAISLMSAYKLSVKFVQTPGPRTVEPKKELTEEQNTIGRLCLQTGLAIIKELKYVFSLPATARALSLNGMF
jgi:hypothetical protein